MSGFEIEIEIYLGDGGILTNTVYNTIHTYVSANIAFICVICVVFCATNERAASITLRRRYIRYTAVAGKTTRGRQRGEREKLRENAAEDHDARGRACVMYVRQPRRGRALCRGKNTHRKSGAVVL